MTHGKLQDLCKILFFVLLLSFVIFLRVQTHKYLPLKREFTEQPEQKPLALKWLTIKNICILQINTLKAFAT